MNSALWRSAFCQPADGRSDAILSLFDADRVFKIHMQLALDHAVIQLAALIRLAAVATFEQRVRTKQILLHRTVFVARPRSAYSFSACCKSSNVTVRRIGKQYAHIAVIALWSRPRARKTPLATPALRVLDGQLRTQSDRCRCRRYRI